MRAPAWHCWGCRGCHTRAEVRVRLPLPGRIAGTGVFPARLPAEQKEQMSHSSPGAELAQGSRTLLRMHWLHFGRLGNPDCAGFREPRAVWGACDTTPLPQRCPRAVPFLPSLVPQPEM